MDASLGVLLSWSLADHPVTGVWIEKQIFIFLAAKVNFLAPVFLLSDLPIFYLIDDATDFFNYLILSYIFCSNSR